jgi:flagella basal body P-ring formation protein FlgA
MKRFGICLLALLIASPALANDLVLKSNPTDADGRITIGDVFDNAGNAAGVLLGYRSGATAVLDAATVQMVVSRNGASWDNPRGQRRIIVGNGADGAAPVDASADAVRPAQAGARNRDVLTYTHSMNAGDVVQAEDLVFASVAADGSDLPNDARPLVGKVVRYPVREGAVVHGNDLTQPVVVKRSETVKVTWSNGGLSLSMSGVATKDGARGDLIQVQNPTSKKMIDAVIVGPGEALAGPAADQLRSRMFLSSR